MEFSGSMETLNYRRQTLLVEISSTTAQLQEQVVQHIHNNRSNGVRALDSTGVQ